MLGGEKSGGFLLSSISDTSGRRYIPEESGYPNSNRCVKVGSVCVFLSRLFAISTRGCWSNFGRHYSQGRTPFGKADAPLKPIFYVHIHSSGNTKRDVTKSCKNGGPPVNSITI